MHYIVCDYRQLVNSIPVSHLEFAPQLKYNINVMETEDAAMKISTRGRYALRLMLTLR
jgi:hypothetical protein